MGDLSLPLSWPTNLWFYFFSPVHLMRGVIEQLCWIPTIQSGSSHHIIFSAKASIILFRGSSYRILLHGLLFFRCGYSCSSLIFVTSSCSKKFYPVSRSAICFPEGILILPALTQVTVFTSKKKPLLPLSKDCP